jgi:hypothetical protein
MPNDAVQNLRIPGFSKPESVVHDTKQDVYFVSNVGAKSPSALDGDGFISRAGLRAQPFRQSTSRTNCKANLRDPCS